MLDHIGLAASDITRSRAFYQQVLAPLGIVPVMELDPEQTGGTAHVGFGADPKPFFWISGGPAAGSGHVAATHVAFQAPSRAAVDAFHAAALAAGGRDHGAPGLRPHYHPHYYGAFVLDPDDNNIEAVCHHPE